jgi:hypothetical protein
MNMLGEAIVLSIGRDALDQRGWGSRNERLGKIQ